MLSKSLVTGVFWLDLEVLRISSVHGNRDLGITDFSVIFGFLEMKSLRTLQISTSQVIEVKSYLIFVIF